MKKKINMIEIKNYLLATELVTLWRRLFIHLFILFCTTHLFGIFILKALDTVIETLSFQSLKPMVMVFYLICAYGFFFLPIYFSCRLFYYGRLLTRFLSGIILIALIMLIPMYWMVLLAIALGTSLDLNRMS